MGRDRGEITCFSQWSRSDVPEDCPWDIYWEDQYCRAFESLGDGTPGAFLYRDGARVWFHVFLRRHVHQTEFWDLKTAYGYGGPTSNTDDVGFLKSAQASFSQWCRSERIVTEFTRFHPILETQRHRLEPETKIEMNRETVWVDLRKPWTNLVKQMSPAFLRGVRKGRQSGLICEEIGFSEGIGTFRREYHQTMKRVGARPYYLFPEQHFDLLNRPAIGPRLFRVSRDGETLAMALLLSSNTWCHYHLGASAEAALTLRPNNVLFYGLLEILSREAKWVGIHFGGGTTPAADNPLLRFKASLSQDRAFFFTGKTVFLAEAHQELAREFPPSEKRYSGPGGTFPAYRVDEPEPGRSDDGIQK